MWRDWFRKAQAAWSGLPRVAVEPEPPSRDPEHDADGYRIFRTRYDVVVDFDKLADVLGALSPAAEQAHAARLDALRTGLAGWRTAWMLEAMAVSERLRSAISPGELEKTCVFVLVDHSGSMRGQPILLAAAAVEALALHLRALGVGVDIAGFTTVRWKGGLSREDWIAAGKPPNPGRLNDRLHVVYTPKGPAHRTPIDLGPMLLEDLLKENIDGEALEWAAARLLSVPHAHKVLLVISDGAPVDDATLSANPETYLDAHLRRVVATLESDSRLTVGAIGIGHSVSRYYRRSLDLDGPGGLGTALLEFSAQLLLDATSAKAEGARTHGILLRMLGRGAPADPGS